MLATLFFFPILHTNTALFCTSCYDNKSIITSLPLPRHLHQQAFLFILHHFFLLFGSTTILLLLFVLFLDLGVGCVNFFCWDTIMSSYKVEKLEFWGANRGFHHFFPNTKSLFFYTKGDIGGLREGSSEREIRHYQSRWLFYAS